MKILFVQPTGDKRGHYGVYTTHVCQEIARQGGSVTLFTNKIYPDRFISEKPLFEILEFKNGKYSFEKFDHLKKKLPFLYLYAYLRNSFVAIREAIKYLKKNDFDIVFVMDTEYGALSLLLKLFGKKIPPLVLMVQAANFSFKKFPGNFLFKTYKSLQREILKSAIEKRIKAFLVLGEFHKEELTKQLKLKRSFPIKVVYDGADPPKIFLDKKLARKKLKINYQKSIFLFFGMLRKDKGIEYLLEAVSLLKDEKFKLVIAGSLFDYTEKEINKMIEKLSIREKLILCLGYIKDSEVPLYFFSSDVVIFPYRKIYTGGSGPLLKQAVIYKTPVIASNVSEMGRLVKRHKIGFVAESENVKDLADKMKKFLSMTNQEKKELADNAAKVTNTWLKIGKEYLNFFKEIIDEKN